MEYGLAGERPRRGKNQGRMRVSARSEYKAMTPIQSAQNKLKTALMSFSDLISAEVSQQYVNRLGNLETLPHMNMRTLAATIVLYNLNGGQLKPDLFDDRSVKRLIDRLVPERFNEKSEAEQRDIYTKYKQSMLRYYSNIQIYFSQQQQ
jgi:hypothetical protein